MSLAPPCSQTAKFWWRATLTTGLPTTFYVARYNDDGSLDTDFGSDGVVITDLGGRDIARSVTVQPDGKILVAGDTATESGDFASDFALVRYNDDGTPDTDFGTGGVVITDLGYVEGSASASVTVANDKILLAGLSLMARNMTLFWCVTTSMMDHWIPALAHRHPDPIILDLGPEGIDLSYTAAFDLNGDGQLDNIAWPGGQDGMLVMDLDGSGAIEDGTEVFSPDFGPGGYADALDALASLDSNHDGVTDSADPGFANLLVWQDQNHDGVSDAGELKTLADLGITGIYLNATASSGTIDGQQLLAEGTFTYADGQTGNYVMVALGQASPDSHVGLAKLDYSRETGGRGVIANLSNAPVQANIGYGIATVAALTALDAFGNEQALAAGVQEVAGTDQADALLAGTTSVTFDAGDGNDNLRGGAEADTLIGGGGDDHIAGGGGADTLDGGQGTDTIDYGDSTSGVRVNLDDSGDAWNVPGSAASPADGEIGGGFAIGNRLIGIENIAGSSHGDGVNGNASANRLDGGAGDDVLRGEAGDDTLLGGEGNDTLEGGDGSDTLNGGLGDDTLAGGPGNDTIDGGDGSDTADYSQEGGPHGVIVNLSDQPITADLGNGAETVAAMSAIDTFGDMDILSGIENVVGTEFRDVLVGPGNGVKLMGGGGADTFMLTGINIADLIVDYNQAEGDTIDLTALYHEFTAANGTVSTSDFINEHVHYDQDTGALAVDMDGDKATGYEQQVATVNETGSSVSSSLWLRDDGVSSSDSSADTRLGFVRSPCARFCHGCR